MARLPTYIFAHGKNPQGIQTGQQKDRKTENARVPDQVAAAVAVPFGVLPDCSVSAIDRALPFRGPAHDDLHLAGIQPPWRGGPDLDRCR